MIGIKLPLMKRFSSSKKVVISLFFIFFLLAFLTLLKYNQKADRQNLNLVIISIDTLRADHMGVYGYNRETTPNIDNFAKSATVFTNYRTTVPMTYPSFASLMTGKDPFETRIFRNRGLLLSDNNKTLATILKENGYNTYAFVTGALNSTLTKLDQGFDQYNYLTYKSYTFTNNKERYLQTSQDQYEQFLNQANNLKIDSKFFVWFHLMDPHAPYEPPDNLKCQFDDPNCSKLSNKTWDELEAERMDHQLCQKEPVPGEVLDRQMKVYDSGIAYSDNLVARILDSFKKRGLDKNAVIVILADHGEGFDHNYYFNHRGVLYESALRVPLIIKTPQVLNGSKTAVLAVNTDFLPTILETLGINHQDYRLKGNDFSSQVTQDLPQSLFHKEKSPIIYALNSIMTKFAIIENNYKYIYSLPQSCLLDNQTEELYNLKSDPQEANNLVESQLSLSQEMKEKLFKYLAPYNLPPTASNPNIELNYSQDPEDNNNGSSAVKVLPY